MKFYGRSEYIDRIKSYKILSENKGSKILVITGRRRIGKTRLIIEATEKDKRLYFYVSRKKIAELLLEWSEMIKDELGEVFFGKISSIEELLSFLFQYTKSTPLTVVFDEFQNFNYSDKYVYSVFQKYFDLGKEDSALFMILSGSSFSLMERIFKGNKEPLFGRASEIINLSYLSLKSQKQFLNDENLKTTLDQILFYSIFDGVPKYWEAVDEMIGKSFKMRLKAILISQDWIWEEGETILKEEFGKDYASYYSILSAIAKGRRILSEIEQYTGISNATIYLQRLKQIYQLIENRFPITKNGKSRQNRWYIKDNFFQFWFGYIEPKKYLNEIGQKEMATEMIVDKLHMFSGKIFEKMIVRKLIEDNPLNLKFTKIGNYWDRKGKVEIDIIVLNEETGKYDVHEVKASNSGDDKKKKVKNELYTRDLAFQYITMLRTGQVTVFNVHVQSKLL